MGKGGPEHSGSSVSRALSGPVIYQPQIVQDVAQSLGASPHFARMAFSAVIESISAHLLAGRRVQIRGFGEFWLKPIGRRICNLPGHDAFIGGHRHPAWSPSAALKTLARQSEIRNPKSEMNGPPQRREGASSPSAPPGAAAVHGAQPPPAANTAEETAA